MADRLVVHGHFYQPPRENPWTGVVEAQPSAAPFHDWNDRVHTECYRPATAADITTPWGERTVRNLERMSFNFGPTLMTWLEQVHPSTYNAILDADRFSCEALGHGNAIAQAYHHTILPLSPLRDVRTEVRWGLADFAARFGRNAEGMWLPETAANDDVLSVLIEEGVAFTILAPHQAGRWREPGGAWNETRGDEIDIARPYRWMHPDGSGRSIGLWFYDGPASRSIAFDDVTSAADRLLDLLQSRAHNGLVHVATDGETYGHHQKFADICLAYTLFVHAEQRGMTPSNYALLLEETPPEHEVELAAGRGTSWSCTHGVERWAADCGCSTGGAEGWNQAWRTPLRVALETLRNAADEAYERLGGQLLRDPWGARDRYVRVRLGGVRAHDFLSAEASAPIDEATAEQALTLLELQRNALAMFTSCAWFFADVGGIETVQILRYAARTIELLEALEQPVPVEAFMAALARAKSNDPTLGDAAAIFMAQAQPQESVEAWPSL